MASVDDIRSLLKENNTLIKNDIDNAKSDVLESVKSHIETAKTEVIAHVDKQLAEVKSDVTELKDKLNARGEEIQDLKKARDRELRSRNIVIFKIPENETGVRDLKFKVIKMIQENLNIDITNYFDKVFRIGKKDDSKIRPIMLSLTSHDKKMEIFWEKKQRESTLEMSEDMAPDVLARRRKLVPILRSLKDLNYSNVQLRQDKLYVDGTECDEAKWTQMLGQSSSTENVSKRDSTAPDDTAPNDVQSTNNLQNNTLPADLPLHQPLNKRGRDESTSSPIRTSKIIKDSQKSTPTTKTTIVGINNGPNSSSVKNPIKDALRNKLLPSTPSQKST